MTINYKLTQTALFIKEIKKRVNNPIELGILLREVSKKELDKYFKTTSFTAFKKHLIKNHPITICQILEKELPSLIIDPVNKASSKAFEAELNLTPIEFQEYYKKTSKLNFNLLKEKIENIPLLQKEAEEIDPSCALIKPGEKFFDDFVSGLITYPFWIGFVTIEMWNQLNGNEIASLLEKKPYFINKITIEKWNRLSKADISRLLEIDSNFINQITSEMDLLKDKLNMCVSSNP